MAKDKTTKAGKLLDYLSENLRKISLIIAGVTAILGAFAGMTSWFAGQVKAMMSEEVAALNSEIVGIKEEMHSNHEKTDRQITRLELLNLIHNQPTNVAEIEKVARHYFQDLKADWYMTGIYSRWCSEYGGSTAIIAGVE